MASEDSYMASIEYWGANFAPRYWSFCNGQVLSIGQYSALFSLLSTNFGGDGVTNFRLPDLRSRVAVGVGAGPGLSQVFLGQAGGYERVTLSESQLAPHNHGVQDTLAAALKASNQDATTATPGPDVGLAKSNNNYLAESSQMNTNLSGPKLSGSISTESTGSGSPHENRQPYLGVNAIICIDGIYPPRP